MFNSIAKLKSKDKKIAVVQSNYIPWKGYFDLIRCVDEFILFDDMQYTRRDWRNRNRIKTPAGPAWLTIPVVTKGNYLQKIKDTVVADQKWRQKHWQSICHNYSKARYFNRYAEQFKALYLDSDEKLLSLINYGFIFEICKLLNISTEISWSMDYQLADSRNTRLLSLCQQTGATEYVSGPSAQSYLDSGLFREANMRVTFFNYAGYPEYGQRFPPFRHDVSVIDLIFNEGPSAHTYLERLQL